ncbi:TSC22 domain family protein 2 [Gadus morhua]|nr:TSC22 domain family protein 2 [Gadus morhua]
MSKMPAKKKSCFQITSVTQAQVAASSITDDTESLDDPDESRTEDLSSGIFDGSRADLGVCDRSSSEETLNSVEAHESQPALTGPVNGGFFIKSIVTGHVPSSAVGSGVPVAATSKPSVLSSSTQSATAVTTASPAAVPSVTHTAPVATSSISTVSCSSRFRVIKLDHGTGEPFRRGRWTCTEFYDRDSEGSSMSRTVDSIKQAVTLDHSKDRDSGFGATGSSVVGPNAVSTPETASDSSGHRQISPVYGRTPQIGSGTSAFQPTGHLNMTPQQQGQVTLQAVAAQNLLPGVPNGGPQDALLQKSPIMPPVTQNHQDAAYFNHPASLSNSQQEYCQQHFVPQGSSTQNAPTASHPVGPLVSQGPSPVITSAGPTAHGSLLQPGSGGPIGSTLPVGGLQEAQSLGGVGGAPAPSVPAAAASATHSGGLSNVPATVPNNTHTLSGLHSQPLFPEGLPQGYPPSFSSHGADGRRQSDALPQPAASAFPGMDGVRPFIPESLRLVTPTVNSLFGISIAMDEDEDSASGASLVAIDNKIEQAMDLVKSHLMYAVREEVEVLKEQIKELYERNSMLERENAVLKSLANTEQLGQLSSTQSPGGGTTSPPQLQHLLGDSNNTALNNNNNNTNAMQHEGGPNNPHQPNVTSA